MFDSRKQNPNCNFADEVVSYIYDEMKTSEKTDFETHLAECSPCADEITAFSNVSFSIKEWRNEEFANLQTPNIIIPYEIDKVTSDSVQTDLRTKSWFDSLSELVNFSPAFLKTATAFGTLALAIGLAWFLMASPTNKNDSLAEKDKPEKKEEISTPVITDKSEKSVEPEVAVNENKETNKVDDIEEPTKIIAVNTPDPKLVQTTENKIVKVKNTPTEKKPNKSNENKENLNSNPVQKDSDLNKNKQENIKIQEIPSLANFALEDIEEDDLRLTDLFADVESGD